MQPQHKEKPIVCKAAEADFRPFQEIFGHLLWCVLFASKHHWEKMMNFASCMLTNQRCLYHQGFICPICMQAWTNQEELLQHWQSAHDQLTFQVCYSLLTLNIFFSFGKHLLNLFLKLLLTTGIYENLVMKLLNGYTFSFPYFKISIVLTGIEARSVLHVLLFLPFCLIFPLKAADNVLSSCVFLNNYFLGVLYNILNYTPLNILLLKPLCKESKTKTYP